jgi:hypothetical protein
MEHRIMAKTKSSTKTAALRSDTKADRQGIITLDDALPERNPPKTAAHAALWHQHDGCHLIADDLHSLVMCMITLADAHFDFVGEEKGLARSYIEWQIVLKSRELQVAFK